MLTIAFTSSLTQPDRTYGPVPFFRIEGATLLAGPELRVVARHLNSQWEYEGHMYTILRVDSPVRLEFDNCTNSFKINVPDLEMRDSHLYSGSAHLGVLDEKSGRWVAARARFGSMTASTVTPNSLELPTR